MSDKGPKLNKRVWTLFESAGFSTKPNSNDPTEEPVELPNTAPRPLDLSATALGVKIIGSNKSGWLHGSFSGHVHDFATLIPQANADRGLLVFTAKELTPADVQYASQANMAVWSEAQLEYYEALVDAIGPFAKYEIIHSLGLSTAEETNIHNVLAVRLKQPTTKSPTELFAFTATPEVLLKTSVVLRRAQGSSRAYQRILQKSRLSSIRRFVSSADALLPTVVVVHLSDAVTWLPIELPKTTPQGTILTIAKKADAEIGILGIPLQYASLELIDGQHRLFGFVNADEATKQFFNLAVIGIKALPPDKRTSTFVAINDNARRMDPNLVAYLKYTDDEAICQADNELLTLA